MINSISLTELQSIYEETNPEFRGGMISTLFEINKSVMKKGKDYVTKVGRYNVHLTISGYAIILNSLPLNMDAIRKVTDLLLTEEPISAQSAYESARKYLDELAVSAGIEIEKFETEKLKNRSSEGIKKNLSVAFTQKPYTCVSNTKKEATSMEMSNSSFHIKEKPSLNEDNSWDTDANIWTKENATKLRETLSAVYPHLKKKEIAAEATLINKKILIKMRDVYGFVIDEAVHKCKEKHCLDFKPSVQVSIYDDEVWRSIFGNLLEDTICKLKKEAI